VIAVTKGRDLNHCTNARVRAKLAWVKWTMAAKCANAACPHVFRSCLSGRFFRFPVETNTAHLAGGGSLTQEGDSHFEYYWLCERCARIYTLVYLEGAGVTLEPRWKNLASPEILKHTGVA
jgi:hypothetical protein